ncbi:MAG: Ig-like domain-containing protein [Nitrospirae bacterium]|nr:Ig-like domain-containing protein [Candidatus Manganitrophaceae bacterium]
MLERVCLGIVLGLSLLLSSCGGGGGGSKTIAQIEITPQQGNVVLQTTLPFSATAKTASGEVVDNVSFVWQSLDPSIASIDPNSGVATGHGIGVATLVATTGTFQGSASIGVVAAQSGQGNLHLSGTVRYEDKPYTLNGFTGEIQPKAVRGAAINVVAIDGFTTIFTGATDAEGNFDFTGVNNTGRRSGIYLQVLAKTEPNNPTQVEIRNNLTDKALFSLASNAMDDSGGSDFTGLDVTAAASSGAGGAFNILDVFSTASELIQRSGGPCSPPATAPCVPPLLTAYWEPGSAQGTYFDDQLDAIFILGGGDPQGDTDEYDDAVIAHEYGHFAVHHFSKDDSLGGEHFITDHDQDVRLAWSEGWGNFFSSAVRKNPIYVDTASKGATFSFNLETYASPQTSALKSAAVYTTSEIAVAGVLWDLFDDPTLAATVTEPHDTLALGLEPIWQTLRRFTSGIPATMESFVTEFTAVDPGSAGGLQAILQERKMELLPDSFESNEAATFLVANDADRQLQHHTLYQAAPVPPENDEDIIPFDVAGGVRYTLETFTYNGADTLLFLNDQPGSGAPLNGLQNDNRDGGDYHNCGMNTLTGKSSCPDNNRLTLSSSLSWTPTASARLYAHVQRSPNAPPSAGQFGSYDIRLSSP